MIRTESEYRDALERMKQDREIIQEQRKRLQDLGLNAEELNRAMEPFLSFHEQLREEVEAYEAMRRGDPAEIDNLEEMGRILIGLRIAKGFSQKELAEALGVSESQVSRDERNDYHGITVERAQRVISALKGRVRVCAEVSHTGEMAAV